MFTDSQLMDMAFEAEDGGNFHEILCRVVEKYEARIAELEAALKNAEEEISVVSSQPLPQRFSEYCFDNR